MAPDTHPSQQTWQTAPLKRGAIAAGNPDATAAGLTVLEAGGNAIDAIIAAAFAMGVVEPLDSGLGAGGFMTIHDAASGETTSLDFLGVAPVSARYTLYQQAVPRAGYGIFVKGRDNERGHRSVAVPGTARGFVAAHARFGRMPWREVMEPAIRLAVDGFTVSKKSALRMSRSEALMRLGPEIIRVHTKDGALYVEGDAATNPDYGESLRQVAEEGDRPFYEGAIAKAIVADMAANHGFLVADDLLNYRAIWRKPAHGRFDGLDVFTVPPPSSGMLVTHGLEVLEASGPAAIEGQHWEPLARAMLEMFRLRSLALGDPGFVPDPRDAIASARESSETTSLSAIDAEGNGVSITFSNNNHSGIVTPVTGILLNNQMTLFVPWEGSPNSVAGGKRPTSSMMPTLALENGRVVLALGASGSTRIPTGLMQVLFNHRVLKKPLQEAVDTVRLHAEVESLYSDAELATVAEPLAEKLGLTFTPLEGRDTSMAVCQAIGLAPDGTATAVGDPRARACGRVI